MNLFRAQKSFFPLIVLLFLTAVSCKEKSNTGFHYAADFNPSEATCFVWTEDYHQIVPKLAGIISAKDNVMLFVGEDANRAEIKNVLKKYNSNLSNIEFIPLKRKPQIPWLRDFGPVYLTNGKGKKKIVNFQYFRKRNIFNEQLSEVLKVPLAKSNLSSTGGARETNGKGVVILCEAHELEENKPKNRQQIEAEILQDLSLKKVIWLKKGIPQDDGKMSGPLYQNVYPNGVNGHIDEFCRFANDSTILISSVSESEAQKHPILSEAKERLDENYNILVNSTDQDGKKFRVIKVPFAPLQIIQSPQTGRMVTSVTSYMNFIVTNSAVILPSYLESAKEFIKHDYLAKEKEVVKIFESVFPEKKITSFPAADLNRFGGGFHCISLNIPL